MRGVLRLPRSKLAKTLFIKEPANMRLLVVVDKLLTGFDAPPCTYLYIDKSMQDHGLFQAICRVNRLDTEDKDFDYIVDDKDFVQEGRTRHRRLHVRTRPQRGRYGAGSAAAGPPDEGPGATRPGSGGACLACEPVESPKGDLEHIHYFCGNTEIPSDLQEREPHRVALYKATVALVRAYGNIADELTGAGYADADIARIKDQLGHYLKVREIIRKASGESLDLKAYEADMRHLLDTYIEADEPRKISPFDNMGLLELIVKTGIANPSRPIWVVPSLYLGIALCVDAGIRSGQNAYRQRRHVRAATAVLVTAAVLWLCGNVAAKG